MTLVRVGGLIVGHRGSVADEPFQGGGGCALSVSR